ncbi:MAG: LCP family protein [Lachnospiraceae bacterium]|nr:LCP family protein [Lachnospiraceae bacterium]
MKKRKVALVILCMVLVFTAIAAGTYSVLRHMGKERLRKSIVTETRIEIESEEPAGAKELKEGQLRHKGRVYELNEDLITILMMGIDKESLSADGSATESTTGSTTEAAGEAEDNLAGGQADALFLLVIDPHTEEIKIVAINRNTMTAVDTWDREGNYLGTFQKQIALQHGYGDGREESCERQANAVSRLFLGIPINGYVAIGMDAIEELNDAVGGVEVTVLEDVGGWAKKYGIHEGDVVTLTGEQAYEYVRNRDWSLVDSNERRLKRQKQYLTAFVPAVKRTIAGNVGTAMGLYDVLSDHMVTDVDLSEFTYMATEFMDYHVDVENIVSPKGKIMEGDEFKEYYLVKKSLEDLIVELFYEEVPE